MNAQLQALLSEREAEFHFDGETWCLHGIANGLGWETDDFESDSRKQAELDAIDYLEAVKANEAHDALEAEYYESLS